MLKTLRTLLGPARHGQLNRYLAWLVGYCVLEGLTVILLVPILTALLAGEPTRAASWITVLAVMTILTGVARYIQTMRGFALALVILETLHERLGAHVARLPLRWFCAERVGRLSRSATSGTLMATNVFAHLLSPVVAGVLVPCVVGLAMLVLDWRLGLTVLLCAPLIIVSHRWSADAIGRSEQAVDAAAGEASNRVIEFVRTQHTLRAFGRTEQRYPPLEASIEAQRTAGGSMIARTFPRLFAGGLSVHLAFAAIITVGCLLAWRGVIQAAALVALLAPAARLVAPLAEAAARSGLLRMAANDLHRIVEVLETPTLPEPKNPRAVHDPGRVELAQVRFGYRDDAPVIRDLSLDLPPGSLTAIVGASGAGKSTLFKLLMRFCDVDAGTVRVGGVDVRHQATDALMAQFAPVFQDVYLFNDTLEANIRIGRAEASGDDIHEAARLAGVDEIVARLPQGWATPVGEGGSALSGGERQRVSLARALVKDAPIVLLDEATAALDANNQRVVQHAIERLRGRATVIVIAHQLPTVRTADRIVVLEAGGVVESGRHEQLIAADGRYAAFWRNRARAAGWRISDPVPT